MRTRYAKWLLGKALYWVSCRVDDAIRALQRLIWLLMDVRRFIRAWGWELRLDESRMRRARQLARRQP